MAGSDPGLSPGQDELEVSIFGPGYGESIVLHLGRGNWIVVDSCLKKNKQPAAIEYLRSIGQDPTQCVKLIVATHWHDDHVGGLGSLVEQCPNSSFVCSDALRKEEFRTLVSFFNSRGMMKKPGVKEFHQVLCVLEKRSKSKSGVPQVTFASPDKLLWRESTCTSYTSEVHSLSPSNTDILLAHGQIAALLQEHGQTLLGIPEQSPNHAAIVLLIKVGNANILLGSDLEETTDATRGWTAVLDLTHTPKGKSQIFKVPHHGSQDSHQPRVWTELLVNQPFAVLSPFIKGDVILPRKTDVTRICSYTSNAYITAMPIPKQGKVASNIVNKGMAETARWIREVPSSTGMVRLRKQALADPTIPWAVKLLDTAVPLQRLSA